MVSDSAVLDTNIIVDYLNSVSEGREEFERYENPSISIVTWMEVLVGVPPHLAAATREFLNALNIIALDDAVAESAAEGSVMVTVAVVVQLLTSVTVTE